MSSKISVIIYSICFVSFVVASPGKLRTWCCTSPACLEQCRSLQNYGQTLFPFGCHEEPGTEECITSIVNGHCDMMFLDGGDIFQYRDSITVVGSEDYGDGDASYYAVAVVKKNAPSIISMDNLNGLRSCHTGVGKTSGWNTPMGWIARRKRKYDANGRLELFDPFKSSCAPGANNPSYMKKLPLPRDPEKWCALCKGDGQGGSKCDRDADEGYYGYNGAFLCLKDGAGDVAFVKHVTVPVDEQDDYRLLCPDGTRAHPSEWRSCNLARVPAHGLVMRNTAVNGVAENVVADLKFAMENISRESFFKSNLMWKSSTTEFHGPFLRNAREFLGEEYYCNMLVLDRLSVPDDCLPK